MLIVIFCIGIALITAAVIIYNMLNTDFVHMALTFFGILFIVGALIGGICMICLLQDLQIIDSKITVCEEVNAEKEAIMEATVKQYMQYEGDTFKDLQPENIMAALSIYPELKSDAMIQDLISTYNKNKEEIKSLKVEKLKEPIYKWWLYFGK